MHIAGDNKKYDVVLLGRIGVDFSPVDYFMPLEKSTTFKKYIGGSPANIAVGLARLGKKAGFFGKVSDDRFGNYALDYFKSEGIDTSRITRCKNGEKMGLAFIEILSESESSIEMYRSSAADLSLSVGDIDEDYISGSRALLVSGTALCASPSRDAAFKAMILAGKNSVPVVFDIDYRPYTWKNKEETGIYYAMAAQKSDIVMGSREEYDLAEQFAGTDGSDAESAAYWHSCRAKIVVIKHGKDGSVAYTNHENGKKKYTVKPFPAKLLKSFGGGDGYASAFLYGLLEGWDMADCLELGSASASILVASHACSQDMPTAGQIKDHIDLYKANNGEKIVKEEVI